MSTITTAHHGSKRVVWVLYEGCEAERFFIESSHEIIEDLKEMAFGNSRRHYRVFYLGVHMRPSESIPTDTSCEHPIHFKKIESGSSKFLILITFFFETCRYFQHPGRMLWRLFNLKNQSSSNTQVQVCSTIIKWPRSAAIRWTRHSQIVCKNFKILFFE